MTGTTDSAATAEAIPTRLMVFGLAHHDGSVHGSDLHTVAAACGVSDESVRSCMRRLITEGLFTREGEGRAAVYRAGPAAHSLLDVTYQRHLLAYAQDAAGRGWDRRWRLVTFAIPEARRSARDAFRDHVLALGGAALQPGVYLSPHPWESEIVAGADRLDLTRHVGTHSTDDLVVGGERDPRRLAAALWPLDDLAARYESFIATYGEVPAELERMRREGRRLSDADFLPGVLHLAVRFNDCFASDPLLPPELLPRPWPGRAARDLLARCRRLGVLARENSSGPALFRVFDEAISHLP